MFNEEKERTISEESSSVEVSSEGIFSPLKYLKDMTMGEVELANSTRLKAEIVPGEDNNDFKNFTESKTISEEGQVIDQPLGYTLIPVDERFKKREEDERMSFPIVKLIKDSDNQPQLKPIYRGINAGGVGSIFGLGKGGKTIYGEGLGMNYCAGRSEFMGGALVTPHNRRVLFVSMEEHWSMRASRNRRQIEYMNQTYKLDDGWYNNYYAVGENFPKYMASEKNKEQLEREIEQVGPGLVIIDSVGRLTTDNIEKSQVATKLMKWLRGLSNKYGITIILIHHTTKLKDKPLNMTDMAGSRVISQELDFMIGINRLSNGTRYIKDVAYRYFPENDDKVLTFDINDHSFVESRGLFSEDELLCGIQPPKFNSSDKNVIKFFDDYTRGNPSAIAKSAILEEHLVHTKLMSIPTLYNSLAQLEKIGVVRKIKRGQYVMISK